MPPTLATGAPTLADHYFRRGLPADLQLLAGGAAMVGLCSQLSIPLWPVPITAQTLGVLLVGGTLGATRGALSLVLYIVLGVAGLPIFSGGASGLAILTGGTGGFLIGFVPAAALIGWLVQRHWDDRLRTAIAAFALGDATIFVFGLPWLAFWLGGAGLPNDVESVLRAGLYPFLIGELVKIVVAAVVLRHVVRHVTRVQSELEDDTDLP